jgi:hypothetical protein
VAKKTTLTLQVGIACVNGRAFRQEARSRALAALLHLCGNWQDDERPLDDVLKEVLSDGVDRHECACVLFDYMLSEGALINLYCAHVFSWLFLAFAD